jgi:protein-disulfide isomerase
MRLGLTGVAALLALGCGAQDDRFAPPTARASIEIGDAPAMGPEDASVVIVEFADFQCPFCGDEEAVVQRVLADYEGRVRLVFKQLALPFHAHARLAAEASLAAHAQGQFWPYHDLLFRHQDALRRSDLEQYASDLGLDQELFRAALDDHTYAASVDADYAEALAFGVPGTPCFFVNGRMGMGTLDYLAFASVIDEELGGGVAASAE